MTHSIVWDVTAYRQLASFMDDDPDGVRAVYRAVSGLADDPRPDESSPYGPTYRRLRADRYRVMYRIEDEQVIIVVINVGRS